ncbi:sterol desaturase family protein [Actibacterium sp. D379-3]
MLDPIAEFLSLSFATLKAQFFFVLAYPFLPGQRIFWLYMVASILLAFFVYRVTARRDPTPKTSAGGFLRFLFPKHVWSHPSAWLDVRYFFFHQVFGKIVYVALLVGAMNFVFRHVTGGPNLIDASTQVQGAGIAHSLISAGYMVVVIASVDLVAYGIHYLQHKLPFLWEFHKVHHSSEVMHPLSNYREHPVDNIFYALGTGSAYGLFMGVASVLFGYVPDMPALLGVPLLMFAFNMLGYNLRHSHVWFRWPGRWSMVVPSPAHHHIHHSCHPDHIDKNFAFMFPIWDVLFRTYHLPDTNKDVRFGISKDYVTEFESCVGLYVVPVRNAYALASRRLKRKLRTKNS